jgi:pyridoxamine 5'-phosphate oxidase-like protein
MTDREPTETINLDGYGDAQLPWSRPRAALEATGDANDTWFLGTATPDGRPHAAGVGALWHEGQLYFTSGPGTRKSKNLAANPTATISVRLDGIDLVFEGVARRVTDLPTLEAAASRYRKDGWPVTVEGDAFTAPFSAPSAGPPPWQLFRLDFDRVFGVATTAPNGATKWRFGT